MALVFETIELTTTGGTPTERARRNFIAHCEAQIKLVEREEGGEVLNRKDPSSRPSYVKKDDGNWSVTLRYGVKSFNINGSNAVKAGKNRKDCIPVLRELVTEAKKGVFDQALLQAATDAAPRKRRTV